MRFPTQFIALYFLTIIACKVQNVNSSTEKQYNHNIKYLNFGFYDFNQLQINRMIKRHPTMRDMYNLAACITPYFIFANELANALNFSLYAVPNYSTKNLQNKIKGHPTFLMEIYITDSDAFDYAWITYWNASSKSVQLQDKNKELPNIVAADNLALNFAYCFVPRTKYESPWHLQILLVPLTHIVGIY